MTKLKPFPGKVRQSVKTYLNQNLGIRTFLGNGLVATLGSKVNILTVRKEHFSVFSQNCK